MPPEEPLLDETESLLLLAASGTAGGLVGFLSMLGRNSLYVFCVGSILSLAGQIVRFIYRGNIYSDTAVIICGILLMALTARLPEWRESIKARASVRSALSS